MAHSASTQQIRGEKSALSGAPWNPWFVQTSSPSQSTNSPTSGIALQNPHRIDGNRRILQPVISNTWARSNPNQEQSFPYNHQMDMRIIERNAFAVRTVNNWAQPRTHHMTTNEPPPSSESLLPSVADKTSIVFSTHPSASKYGEIKQPKQSNAARKARHRDKDSKFVIPAR